MCTTGQPAVQGYDAQAAMNEKQIIVAAELSVESGDFGHFEPMVDATIKELQRVGVSESPETVVAYPGYWHKQSDGEHRRQQAHPGADPAGLRVTGWNKGLYAHMRRVLQTELGQQLYRRRMATVEPVFGQNRFNRSFRRFQRRGRTAAESEWRFQATTHNLLKLHSHRIAVAGA